VPTRVSLGSDFAKVWTASAVSNVGDGVTMIAGPLLVADLTGDPGLVAGAAFVQQLPWLLFALLSGAYADRLDRRLLLVTTNAGRSAILGGLAIAVWLDAASVPLMFAAFFLLGTLESLADSTYQAVLPSIVRDEHLERANARLTATFVVGNQLAAKPLGAYLFVMGAAVPFGFDAATFLVAAALLATLRWRPEPPAPTPARPTLRADIAEGFRALWTRPPLRVQALCLAVSNLLFCTAFATFVLYVQRRLGLDPVGFGVLLSVWALGGLVGTAVAGRLVDRLGRGALLRAGLVVETATQATLAATTNRYVAAAVLVVFGVHTVVWGTVLVSLRQRLVPDRLRGRVAGVFALLNAGGVAAGTLLGGHLAGATSLTVPFWVAAAGMAVVTVVVWPWFTDASITGSGWTRTRRPGRRARGSGWARR
jgi:MFS family permease